MVTRRKKSDTIKKPPHFPYSLRKVGESPLSTEIYYGLSYLCIYLRAPHVLENTGMS